MTTAASTAVAATPSAAARLGKRQVDPSLGISENNLDKNGIAVGEEITSSSGSKLSDGFRMLVSPLTKRLLASLVRRFPTFWHVLRCKAKHSDCSAGEND